MRVAVTWVWLLLTLAQLPDGTFTRKIHNSNDDSTATGTAKTDDDGLFEFFSATFAPLSTYLFGSNDDDEGDDINDESEAAVVGGSDDGALNEVFPPTDATTDTRNVLKDEKSNAAVAKTAAKGGDDWNAESEPTARDKVSVTEDVDMPSQFDEDFNGQRLYKDTDVDLLSQFHDGFNGQRLYKDTDVDLLSQFDDGFNGQRLYKDRDVDMPSQLHDNFNGQRLYKDRDVDMPSQFDDEFNGQKLYRDRDGGEGGTEEKTNEERETEIEEERERERKEKREREIKEERGRETKAQREETRDEEELKHRKSERERHKQRRKDRQRHRERARERQRERARKRLQKREIVRRRKIERERQPERDKERQQEREKERQQEREKDRQRKQPRKRQPEVEREWLGDDPETRMTERLNEIFAAEPEYHIPGRPQRKDAERKSRNDIPRQSSPDLILLSKVTPDRSANSLDTVLWSNKPDQKAGKATLLGNASMIAMSDRRRYQPGMTRVDDLAQYVRTCDSCLVQWDSFQCPLTDMAMELKKWITELEELLSFGCQLGENCAGGRKCCHRRDPVFERAMSEMTEMARRMYNTFQSACSNCPRDGGWSEWREWGSCSASCGAGTRTRIRECSNPTPKGGGRECVGVAMDTMPCSGSDCCKDGGWATWTSWGGCSATCGSGMQERSRTCSNPPPNHCGRTCPGPNKDMRPCQSSMPCCSDGSWGPWTPWSRCSATCGRGSVERRRTCDSPPPNRCGRPCVGPAREFQPCDTSRDCCVPQDGNWGSWTPWSFCSVTCGVGMRDRSRTCSNPPPNRCGRMCTGSARDMEMCDGGECCVHGSWGQWGRWTQCSASCGMGLRERRRRCDNPRNNYCGRPCPGPEVDRESCNTHVPCSPACVHGSWGPWQPWSGCSATCGTGIQSRIRRCDSPPPNFCGRRCPGPPSDTKRCSGNVLCCVPQDGSWSRWSPWSQCSASCGPGTRDRSRTCSNPPPNRCGRTCPGSARDTERCDGGQCCVPRHGNWGSWGSWSQCSATCGVGMRDRSRTCSNPPPNSCGRLCAGSPRDSERCDRGPCCVDGNWGSWERWSQVTVTCGSGIRERRRHCNNPRPSYCGTPCPGPALERELHDTRKPCPIECVPRDGGWTLWSPWSRCSASCGPGMRDRSRTCSNPPPNSCGRRCVGPLRDTGMCNERECCVDGNWSSWGRWSQVTVTCGLGMRERRRRCDNPRPNFCGRSCPGAELEKDMYDTRVPCEPLCVPQNGKWSLWSSWSQCSASCGPGTRDRSRTCSNPPPNRCGRKCSGLARDMERCELKPCCVDGNWGSWQRWSHVTVTCGMGMRKRRRRCDNPRPNYCGRPCSGKELERESYDTGVPCEVCVDGKWAQWSPWGSCSKTCGRGTQERVRTCSNPAPNRCGDDCSGPRKDIRRCNDGPCCVPRDGAWSRWSPWSPCSVSCGPGTRDRSRTCSNPPPNACGRTCPGSARDMKSCEGGSCCVDGNWGSWQRWSQVTATCGTGMRERRRRCDNPRPNFCGRSCSGPDVDTDVYDTGVPCDRCIDGSWGSWGAWGACPVTCGMAVRERRRACDSPTPNHCGRPCPGTSSQTDLQRCGPDPVDGQWAAWESWGACSVTCGRGQQLRRRICNFPLFGGGCSLPCPGPDTDSRSCDLGPCCTERQWSQWGSWGSCDVTCGRGTRSRYRTCQSVGFGPDCAGSTCPGIASEMDSCPGLPRCGESWGPWSPCSATCAGVGTRERWRVTALVTGSLGGRQVEQEACQIFSPPCPQTAEWGEWAGWCPCDCRKGVRSRRRTCNQIDRFGLSSSVDISLCGLGKAREAEYCDVRLACPACASNCTGRPDGDYPSCTSCNDYLRCTGGQREVFMCTANDYEWDAFIQKCVPPPSPSCSLVNCISSCVGREDGRYHSCFGCQSYVDCRNGLDREVPCLDGQEFNAHSGECELQRSPTCVRPIRRTIDFMLRDAPSDSYFAGAAMDNPERRELYMELRQEAGVAAQFNRASEDVFANGEQGEEEETLAVSRSQSVKGLEKAEEEDKEKLKEELERMTEGEKEGEEETVGKAAEEEKKTTVVIEEEEEEEATEPKVTPSKDNQPASSMPVSKPKTDRAFQCRQNCSGAKAGIYPSCKGCSFYILCTKHGVALHRKCPRNRFWDDKRRRCKYHSRTCASGP